VPTPGAQDHRLAAITATWWPLCIAAGADLTKLTEWIAVGQGRAQHVR